MYAICYAQNTYYLNNFPKNEIFAQSKWSNEPYYEHTHYISKRITTTHLYIPTY